MLPIGSFILKATGWCNLNCSYCYMFNLKDHSYLARPRVMSREIVKASAKSIHEYAVSHGLTDVGITIHGGEPLLAGKEWFRFLVQSFRETSDQISYRFTVQTNGVLIDPEWVDLFRELGIVIGLSMDGPREIHDRNRYNHAGRGSYDEVVRGLNLLLTARDSSQIFGGVLCVVDPRENGLSVYRHFRALGVRRIDFLLPLEYNWEQLPPQGASFSEYLIPIFDHWWAEDNPDIFVRLFYEIMLLVFGAKRHIDSLGGDGINLAVIETNGDLEPLDALRACGNGFTSVGLNIQQHAIVALHDKRLFQAAMKGQDGLCATCKACSLQQICGGGYLPNRYSLSREFDNPSVYCGDLWALINHVIESMARRELLSDNSANALVGSTMSHSNPLRVLSQILN